MEIKDLATSIELGSEMADVHGGKYRGRGYGRRMSPWYKTYQSFDFDQENTSNIDVFAPGNKGDISIDVDQDNVINVG